MSRTITEPFGTPSFQSVSVVVNGQSTDVGTALASNSSATSAASAKADQAIEAVSNGGFLTQTQGDSRYVVSGAGIGGQPVVSGGKTLSEVLDDMGPGGGSRGSDFTEATNLSENPVTVGGQDVALGTALGNVTKATESASAAAAQAQAQATAAQSAATAALTPSAGDSRYWQKTADMTQAKVTYGGASTTLGAALDDAAASGSGGTSGVTSVNGKTGIVTLHASFQKGDCFQPSGVSSDYALSAPMAPLESLPASAPLAGMPGNSIIIDTHTPLQEWLGCGGAVTDAAAYCLLTYYTADQRKALLEDLYGPEGFSTVRICMGASDYCAHPEFYTYADAAKSAADIATVFTIEKDFDYVIPVLLEILAINPALKIIAAPWTPPVCLKTSGSTLIDGSFNPTGANYSAYAQYFVLFVQAYAAAGITIYAVSAQNEPSTANSNYPCCSWDENPANNLTYFINNCLAPAFYNANLNTRIIGQDDMWGHTGYINTLLSSGTRYVRDIGWHGYWGSPFQQIQTLGKDRTFTQHLTEWVTWTDQSQESNWWNMFGSVIAQAINYGLSSATLWNVVLDTKGGPFKCGINTPSACVGVVAVDPKGNGTTTKELGYYALRHICQFVRPGAHVVRVESGGSTTSSTIYGTGFLNRDGSVVLIVFNSNKSASQTATIIDEATRTGFPMTLGPNEVRTVTWSPADIVKTGGTLTAPGAPSIASVANNNAGNPVLTIKAPASTGSTAIGSYRVYEINGATKTLLAQVSGSVASFTDLTLTAGSSRTYAVTAVGGGGESPMSATANGTAKTQVATTYTLTANSTSVASGSPVTFTVTPNNSTGAEIVVTPAASGLTGTFSPASVTLPAYSSAAKTFTFTPSAGGTGSVRTTNNGGLTDPAAFSITCSSDVMPTHYMVAGGNQGSAWTRLKSPLTYGNAVELYVDMSLPSMKVYGSNTFLIAPGSEAKHTGVMLLLGTGGAFGAWIGNGSTTEKLWQNAGSLSDSVLDGTRFRGGAFFNVTSAPVVGRHGLTYAAKSVTLFSVDAKGKGTIIGSPIACTSTQIAAGGATDYLIIGKSEATANGIKLFSTHMYDSTGKALLGLDFTKGPAGAKSLPDDVVSGLTWTIDSPNVID